MTITEGLKKRGIFSIIFALVFILIFYGAVGWDKDHTVLLSIILAFSLLHKYSFQIVLALAGFIGFISMYDAMTFLPNYAVNPIHLEDLYDLELKYFGVMMDGRCVSLCEWFEPRMSDFQSFIYGFSYLLWVPGPMTFALFLLWKNKPGAIEFTYCYLLTNFIGIIIYYIYPAAPPWYYLNYGTEIDTTIMGSEAYLSEFDRLIGIPIFQSIYVKGANVFGAIPSLHAAYPLLGLFFAYRHKHKGFVIFFVLMAIGTWIGAVYTWHHYVIDVILGILCAMLAIGLMMLIVRTSSFKRFERFYLYLME